MLGLDPELAIVSKKTGKGRSAHQFITEPQQIKFHNTLAQQKSKGSLQKTYVPGGGYHGGYMIGAEIDRDGPGIEVRSLVRSGCRDNVIPYIAEAMRQASLRLDKWNKGAFKLSSTPKYELDNKSFEGDVPEDIVIFGCNPDMDAYALAPKSPTLDEKDRRRWTGGHIHMSPAGANNNIEEQAALAILFDYVVALPFVAILGDKFAAGEAERREFYGQPGSFRYNDKLSKIEFRTLSGRLLLHPTLLYWATGMVKSLVGGMRGSRVDFLKTQVIPKLDTQTIYNIIETHDVAGAEELVNVVFKLLPNYKEDKNALSNPMSGGGAGTTNPYFFEQAVRVFVEGARNGLTWDDDVKFNWGLYEDFIPMHHSYWGIQQAMVGLCDDDIFPFNKVLPLIWPKEFIQKKPSYRHPLNGGAAPMHGSAGWLA